MSNRNNKTGNVCRKTGNYYCEAHPAIEESIQKDEEFPKCGQGLGHNTIWIKID